MKTKKFKFNGKTFIFNRLWAYKNPWFCNRGQQSKKNVKFIVIHNTGNHGRDSALGNANYFANNKERFAGAHFVIDLNGIIYQCGRLSDACYSVGGAKGKEGSKYFMECTNYNQISIELAGIVDNEPSTAQIEATRAVIAYIRKYCKNAKKIIRHYDVTGKDCPQRFVGADETKKGKAWKKFKKEIQ